MADEKSGKRFFRPRNILALGALAVLLYLTVATRFFAWTPVNGKYLEIDISSGRLRETRWILFLKVRECVKDTWVTKALPADETAGPPDWHTVLVTSPPFVTRSPHTRYHGCASDIRVAEMLLDYADFSAEAKRLFAENILELERRTGGDFAASNYIYAFSRWVYGQEQERPSVSADDLPPIDEYLR